MTRAIDPEKATETTALMERVLQIKNGNRVKSTFSSGEMQRRQKNLRGHMAEANLDAVLLTSYHNVNYFADFLYCSFGRRYGVVITNDKVTSISAGVDGGRPYRRTFGDNITYTDWRKDNYFFAVQQLTKGVKRLGIEFDHVNWDLKQLLETALPEVEFIDVGIPTMWMRTIKSKEEIALIKEGARICDVGGRTCIASIAAGVPEYEVAIASTNAMISEIARAFPHVELTDTWTWIQSGINTDGAHNPLTSRSIQAGDILSINCFPMISGYYTALERTLFCEFASSRHLELWQRNCNVHRRGVELIKPGARCGDIAAELNAIYQEFDLLKYRCFGYGHSFGTLCHYYGREAGVELREDVDTILRPGMVVSMEPMITIPEGQQGAGGYREHDILVVTDTGSEDITKFPFGPEHNIVQKQT